ncbi:LysR family transcriptional regulator [Conexibacter arvalis]|uniref:DNA-binding transcriptional LysR family regulator n=1 Tax=Conexibacter arvalis TaxID=912552 RepID=A0A840IG99_9ACTN|nr:LysR family transcriptional regulator [Conexibacter arvalis]MBB4663094.1 DNA-binding transcriptional LysR family regulator [Conexibacter arvalis]
MELRHLQYFVAVVEERSFTRAAERLHVAQSGVSAQVRQLERELGQTLLDRSARTVRVTDVGAAVLPYARAALAAAAGVREVVDEHVGLLRGRVALGMVTSAADGFDLPALLTAFHRRFPAVDMTLSEATSDLLVAALRAGRLDAAIVAPAGQTASAPAAPAAAAPQSGVPTAAAPAPPAATADGLALHVVADEPLVAAVRPDHPLAKKRRARVPLTALRDQPLISFPRSVGARLTIEEACAGAGFEPAIAFEASDPNVLVKLAAAGLGVAIVPAPYPRQLPPDRLRTLPLDDDRLRGRLALAWRADAPLSPAARALIDHLRGALPAAGEP